MTDITLHDQIKFLAYKHPEWMSVLRSFLIVRKRTGTEKITGSWFYRELKENGSKLLPNNLRPLVRIGVIKKIGNTTRSGHRAYYSLVDVPKTKKTLR